MSAVKFREATGADVGLILQSIRALAAMAVERGCGRMEWVCLDWNQPGIDFYKSKNAVSLDDWTICRLTGDTLTAFAKEDKA